MAAIVASFAAASAVVSTQGGVNPSQRPMIALTITDLQILDVNGDGDVTIRGLDGASLEIEVRGDGAITLDGQLDRLTLDLSGDVSVSAEDLAVEELRLEDTGDGDVVVQVADTVTGKVDGEGTVTIIGDLATIDVQQNGNGKPGWNRAGQPPAFSTCSRIDRCGGE